MSEFTFESEPNNMKEVKKFKGNKGVTYRLAFPAFPKVIREGKEAKLEDVQCQSESRAERKSFSPSFIANDVCFVDAIKTSIIVPPDDDALRQYLTKNLGVDPNKDIKTRVATVVMSIPLDEDKEVKWERIFKDPNTVDVSPFIFSKNVYADLKAKHEASYLWSTDLLADLDPSKAENFQIWKFNVPGNFGTFSTLAKLFEKWKETEDAKVKKALDSILSRTQMVWKNHLEGIMGKRMTVQEIKAKMSSNGNNDNRSVDSSTVVSNSEVDDLLSKI